MNTNEPPTLPKALPGRIRDMIRAARAAETAGDYRQAATVLGSIAELELAEGRPELADAALKLAIDFLVRAAGDRVPIPPLAKPHHEVLANFLDLRSRAQTVLNERAPR